MEIKTLLVTGTDNLIAEYIADIEKCEKEQLNISDIMVLNGSYFVDYSYKNAEGVDVTHIGLEIETLELMEILNSKLNRVIRTLNNIEI